MKTLSHFASIVFVALLVAFPVGARADDAARLKELDEYRAEVSRTVRESDFDGYVATCHAGGVLVSGVKKMSQPLSQALARWKHEFADTKAGKIKANVEFRFSQRMGDGSTAWETGIFLYSTVAPDGKAVKEYIHLEELLVKREGWKVLMEYQKSKATPEEWNALK